LGNLCSPNRNCITVHRFDVAASRRVDDLTELGFLPRGYHVAFRSEWSHFACGLLRNGREPWAVEYPEKLGILFVSLNTAIAVIWEFIAKGLTAEANIFMGVLLVSSVEVSLGAYRFLWTGPRNRESVSGSKSNSYLWSRFRSILGRKPRTSSKPSNNL